MGFYLMVEDIRILVRLLVYFQIRNQKSEIQMGHSLEGSRAHPGAAWLEIPQGLLSLNNY